MVFLNYFLLNFLLNDWLDGRLLDYYPVAFIIIWVGSPFEYERVSVDPVEHWSQMSIKFPFQPDDWL